MANTHETDAPSTNQPGAEPLFHLDMPVHEAMQVHPRVREVFAAFHLGGCSHCALGQFESIGQVCAGYGVDPEALLEVLESIVAEEPQS
ncbi:MAG TPA: disulfide oxidoreductase [Candidatus Hydrogenedentes bacterium]|jgi:hybrid cluster-associated redox disulfide protein|nr:disulfide oxidoreductase [Candidatus Hydrogenedentota bacterium]